MTRTQSEINGFVNTIDKLYTLPEFKLYLDELKHVRDEILSKAYEGDEQNALKIIGLVKGLEIAMTINKRYVLK